MTDSGMGCISEMGLCDSQGLQSLCVAFPVSESIMFSGDSSTKAPENRKLTNKDIAGIDIRSGLTSGKYIRNLEIESLKYPRSGRAGVRRRVSPLSEPGHVVAGKSHASS